MKESPATRGARIFSPVAGAFRRRHTLKGYGVLAGWSAGTDSGGLWRSGVVVKSAGCSRDVIPAIGCLIEDALRETSRQQLAPFFGTKRPLYAICDAFEGPGVLAFFQSFELRC